MIKKLWVKFDGMDISCFCEEDRKKCPPESKPMCEEHVVKFIKIKRDNTAEQIKEVMTREQKAMKDILAKIKRYDTELKKSIRKFKV
jgi:hypothetical protein